MKLGKSLLTLCLSALLLFSAGCSSSSTSSENAQQSSAAASYEESSSEPSIAVSYEESSLEQSEFSSVQENSADSSASEGLSVERSSKSEASMAETSNTESSKQEISKKEESSYTTQNSKEESSYTTQNSKEESSEDENAIEITSITSPIKAGEIATLNAKGEPNTEYRISVRYSSGVSKAAGLEAKRSDSNGNISWSWKVGARTQAGTYSATVSGEGQSASADFVVS